MYFQLLKVVVPDVQAELSAKNIHSKFAPIKLENPDRELFKNLKREVIVRQNVEEDQKDGILVMAQRDHKPILEMLKEIYYEDSEFYVALLRYFNSQKDYADIVAPLNRQMKSLKALQLDQL